MPAATLLLPFGFHVPTQRLITIEEIDEAQRGAACSCVCPGCKSVLFAKFPRSLNGPTRHFAHAPGAQCVAPETLLHKTAKLLVAQERRLWLPARPGKPAHSQAFDAGVSEDPFGPPPPNAFVADAMLTLQARQLLVEIVVTHDLDEPKHRYVIENRLHLVRVDLSTFPREFSLDALRQRLVAPYGDLDRWIYPVPPPPPVQIAEPVGIPDELGPTLWRAVVWHHSHKRGRKVPHVPSCPRERNDFQGFKYANVKLDCEFCMARDRRYPFRYPYHGIFCQAVGDLVQPGVPASRPAGPPPIMPPEKSLHEDIDFERNPF